MTSQGLLQSRKQRESLFAQRREVASNATKGQGTIPTAKTARNFLLNFDHANIAFGLRIVKRHAEVNQESQDGILVLGQPVEQIAGRAVFASSAFGLAGLGFRRGIGSFTVLANLPITRCGLRNHLRRQTSLACCSCLISERFEVQQDRLHLLSPGLLRRFLDEDQVAQQMDIAERVLTPIALIGGPSIMDAGALISWQDPIGIQGRRTTSGMHLVVSQAWGRGDMHPVALARHIQAAFILMDNRCLTQGHLDLLFHVMQLGRASLDQRLDGCRAQVCSQQIREDLTRSFVGQQMLLNQLDGPRPDVGSILDPCRHGFWELGYADLSTARTPFAFGLMLCHLHPWRWQIQHLTALHRQGFYPAQIVGAMLANSEGMLHDFVSRLPEFQCVSLMARLTSWLFPTPFAQAPQFLLSAEAIRGRRQVAIVAVFALMLFQLFHTLAHLKQCFRHFCQLLLQFGSLRLPYGFFFPEGLQFFVWIHALTLPVRTHDYNPLGPLLNSYLYCSGIPVRVQTAVKGGNDGSGLSDHPGWHPHRPAGRVSRADRGGLPRLVC